MSDIKHLTFQYFVSQQRTASFLSTRSCTLVHKL